VRWLGGAQPQSGQSRNRSSEDCFRESLIRGAQRGTLLLQAEQSIAQLQRLELLLLGVEGVCEASVFKSFNLGEAEIEQTISETGCPAGWFPLVGGYDRIPLSRRVV